MSLSDNNLQKIDHFVVIMLENRSFDHMLGFLYREQGNKSPLGHSFEGLTGNESNPDESGNEIKVFPISETEPEGYSMPKADPDEGFIATNEQIYEKNKVVLKDKPTNKGFVNDFDYTLKWEKKLHWDVSDAKPSDIMGIYTPRMLPVLSTLAKSYAVCDHWYGSVPTETLPNRAFALMATSQGRLDDKCKVYTAPSIFKLLEKHNKSWAVYGYTKVPLTRGSIVDITYSSNEHFGEFEDFQNAVAKEKLANFVFLEPSWGPKGNSQHPQSDDVSRGEKFLYDIYNTLYNSKLWEKTLLIITYDEHGGCYDHVAPPENATPPDNCAGMYGFCFTRFGPRVPTILVSPWIQSGTVFRAHNTDDYAVQTPFDHTSILATLEKRFGMQPLTARDAAAPHLGDVLTLNDPRKDNPMENITPPVRPPSDQCECKPTHLQQVLSELFSDIFASKNKEEGYRHIMPNFSTGNEIESYIHKIYERCFEGK